MYILQRLCHAFLFVLCQWAVCTNFGIWVHILVTTILYFGTKVKVFRFCSVDAYSRKSFHGFSFLCHKLHAIRFHFIDSGSAPAKLIMVAWLGFQVLFYWHMDMEVLRFVSYAECVLSGCWFQVTCLSPIDVSHLFSTIIIVGISVRKWINIHSTCSPYS